MASLPQTTELLQLLGDPTRLRLLALLAESELTVAELTRITTLSQSRVSTHLGKLRAACFLADRKVGNSTFYRQCLEGVGAEGRRLWEILKQQLGDELLAEDARRCDAVLQARHAKPGNWADEVAGQMERHYSPGRTWEATARGLIGFLRLGKVLDVGSGDGVNAQLLADRCEELTCLDRSETVLNAARERLGSQEGLRFVQGDMHELPFEDGAFDQVLLFNVLTYSHTPERAVAEAARVLKPGGLLSLVTLARHEHRVVSEAYDHVNLGFDPEAVREMLEAASLQVERCGVGTRERKKPYFQVITAFASKNSTNARS